MQTPLRPRRTEHVAAGSWKARLTEAAGSVRAHELYWWYLSLFCATLLAKLAALDLIFSRNVGSAVDELMASRDLQVPRVAVVAMLGLRDALQTAAITLLVGASAHRLRDRPRQLLLRGSLLLLLLVLAGTHVSFLELGTFVSAKTLLTTWVWVSQKPAAINAYLSHESAMGITLILLWVIAPRHLERLSRSARAQGVRRSLPWVVAALVAGSLLLSPIAAAQFGKRAFPLHGHWASILLTALRPDEKTPSLRDLPSDAELMREFRELAYLPSMLSSRSLLEPAIEARVTPRHVLVVGLETAPRALYPLTSARDLPTFQRMTERAIVSDRHYTTSPYTRIANFSILSGLYAPQSGLPTRFGKIASDGFASVLKRKGYETTYIDSWVLDWLPGSGERDQAKQLGFDAVIDSAVRRDDGVYEVLVEAEEVAFDRAFAQIAAAETRGHRAAIFLGTMLGHAPWVAAKGDEQLDARARVHKLALIFDGLFEKLLERLTERGLSDDVLILVVGDHGLRLTDEFRSLGLRYEHSDLAYNVPFLLYAPGLVDHTVRVPFATSHVDITPTLLHLLGVADDKHLHHGGYVLDRRLSERVVFLPSSELGPLDGLTWRGHYMTEHALSGMALLGVGSDRSSMRRLTKERVRALPYALQDPGALLEQFDRHTIQTAGALLRRAQKP